MLELIRPDEVCLGSEDPTSGEFLCPLEILCTVPELASGVRERVGSDSVPVVNASRLPEVVGRLNDPLDRPIKVELDNCKGQRILLCLN